MDYTLKLMTIVIITILSVNFICDDTKTQCQNNPSQVSQTKTKQYLNSNDAACWLANQFAIKSNGIFDYIEELDGHPVFYVRIDSNNIYANFECVTILFNQICNAYNNVSQIYGWLKTDKGNISTVYKVGNKNVHVVYKEYTDDTNEFLQLVFIGMQ